jgi:hypothetical protein
MLGKLFSQLTVLRHVRGITPYLFGCSPYRMHNCCSTEDEHQSFGPTTARGVSTAMSMINRIRHRRIINSQNRAIDRAWQSAPTQSMRDEIAMFAQRRPL